MRRRDIGTSLLLAIASLSLITACGQLNTDTNIKTSSEIVENITKLQELNTYKHLKVTDYELYDSRE